MTTVVTGGMGFIGLHVVNSLLDEGQDVALTWNRSWRVHESWQEELGKRVIAERVDVANPHDIMGMTLKHKAEGIVYLAAPAIGQGTIQADFQTNMVGLMNALEAANLAGVRRFTYVSSSTVYQNVKAGPYREDMPLPLESRNATEAYKKAGETLMMHYADRTGMSIAIVRPRGVYGPMYYSMVNLPSRLCHAAVKGVAPDFGPAGAPYAEDANDFTNVKDCAEVVRLVHFADTLKHRVYNCGGGRAFTAQEMADAVRAKVPGAKIELKPGANPNQPADNYLDLSRMKDEFGWEPKFPAVPVGIPDYIDWLQTHAQ
jgi:UDP-glucose 4-epimerase